MPPFTRPPSAPAKRRLPLRVGLRVALVTAVFVGVGVDVASARIQGDRPRVQLAAPQVTAIASTERQRGTWRAVVTSDLGVPSLVIELFDRDRVARGDLLPTLQRRIDGFAFGHGHLSFSGQAVTLDALRWKGRKLHFEVDTGTERLRCAVPVRGRRAFVARCGDAPTVAPVPPSPPPQRNWAADPETIRACGAATFGEVNQNACLASIAGFRYDPAPVVAACDAAMFGDEHTLTCIATAARARRDPSAALQACDATMFGDENALACFELAARARYEPTRVVHACDDAMFGDDNALVCIRDATRAPRDVSEQIRVCDEAMFGDDAALACLRRGISF